MQNCFEAGSLLVSACYCENPDSLYQKVFQGFSGPSPAWLELGTGL